MSFGQKNPWPRANSGQMNPLFQNITGQQFANIPGMIPNLNAIVNTAAFGGVLQQQARSQIQQQNTQSQQQSRKTVFGSITKLLDSYGFIDEEIFFQTNVVTGGNPFLGSRVMCEAVYNASMPFKWNATSVQVLTDNSSQQHSSSRQMSNRNRWEPQHNGGDTRSRDHDRGYGSHVRDSRDSRDYSRRSPPRRLRRSPPPMRRSPSPIRREREREKRERSRTKSPRRGSTRDRSSSPPRRRARVVPRYTCKIPKILSPSTVYCTDLRVRYKNLYVPSDFIQAKVDWIESFNLENQFKIGLNPINFHILHKDVDVPEDIIPKENLQPAEDEDHRFSVKTLLLCHNGMIDFNKKVFGLLPDGSVDETNDNAPFNKGIQFLTGVRGRNEVMALGGAWSPSKDGENPYDLPTQINTAVRKLRELIGVDLSACQTWYKIAQLEYYRSERDRVDTVVLLMPDTSTISGLMPTEEEYNKSIEKLKEQLAAKIAEIDAEEFISSIEKRKKEVKEASVITDPETENKNDATIAETTTSSVTDATAIEPSNEAESSTTAPNENNDTSEEKTKPKGPEKIHWDANITSLRVAELRDQLSLRGLDTKGVKNVLVQRLQKALNSEREIEESGANLEEEVTEEDKPEVIDESTINETTQKDSMDISSTEIKKEEIPEDLQNTEEVIRIDQLVEKTEEDEFSQAEQEEIKREREQFERTQEDKKQTLNRHFTFPEKPTILIYPSKIAKNGRFDAKVSSLSSLLEYRIEDSKEASFEVFLFSECIKEMFDRLHGFNLYKTLECINDNETLTNKRKEALIKALKDESEKNLEAKTDESAESNEKKDSIDFTSMDEADILLKFRTLVNNVELFTSFAYYDTNLTGYIVERDLEDILLSISVRLSRGDVGRILKRVIPRDRFYYRPYVDRYVDKNNETQFTAEFRENAPSMDKLINAHAKTLTEFNENKPNTVTPDITTGGMVIYKGAAVNIKQTLDQHQEIKDEVTRLFAQVQEQDHLLKNYKEQVEGLEKRKKRLETDIIHYKKKAYEAEKCLKTNEDDVVLMKSALHDCKRYSERIINVVERMLPIKEKTKEPSLKPSTPSKKEEVNNDDNQKVDEKKDGKKEMDEKQVENNTESNSEKQQITANDAKEDSESKVEETKKGSEPDEKPEEKMEVSETTE